MSRMPAAERRDQLLECAAQLFADNGYARATTAQLAKAAGVTEPIIYRHFKSKKDLFVALIERIGQATIDQWERDLAGATDPAHRLKLLIGDNPMVSGEGRRNYLVFLQAISEADEPDIQDALDNHMHALHAFLVPELTKAQENRRVTGKFSADLLAWLMIYVGLGYGVSSAMGVKDHGIDLADGTHVQEVIAKILVRGRGESGSKPAEG